jgi:hypothetical protein
MRREFLSLKNDLGAKLNQINLSYDEPSVLYLSPLRKGFRSQQKPPTTVKIEKISATIPTIKEATPSLRNG